MVDCARIVDCAVLVVACAAREGFPYQQCADRYADMPFPNPLHDDIVRRPKTCRHTPFCGYPWPQIGRTLRRGP